MIGESIYASNDYDYISVCYYDDRVTVDEPKTLDQYHRFVKNQRIRGSTNFVAVFNYIEQFLTGKGKNVEEVSVIFFTDG